MSGAWSGPLDSATVRAVLRMLAVVLAALVLTTLDSHAAQPPTSSAGLPARIASRGFPSVFQSWSPADNVLEESLLDATARHDLLWNLPEYFGLRWNSPHRLLGDGFVEGTVEAG